MDKPDNPGLFVVFSARVYALELLRPWKLCTFGIALGYYVWGGIHYKWCPTWDVPVSFIMSVLTYLCAPWTVDNVYHIVKTRPAKWPLGLLLCFLVAYACASGSYELYNWWHLGSWPPPTYWVNLYYSLLMFFAAGMLWRFRGTFMELLSGLRPGRKDLSA